MAADDALFSPGLKTQSGTAALFADVRKGDGTPISDEILARALGILPLAASQSQVVKLTQTRLRQEARFARTLRDRFDLLLLDTAPSDDSLFAILSDDLNDLADSTEAIPSDAVDSALAQLADVLAGCAL